MAERGLEQPHALGNDAPEDARPLASAGDEQLQWGKVVEWRERQLAKLGDLGPNRIADEHRLAAIAGLEAIDWIKGGGDRRGARRLKAG